MNKYRVFNIDWDTITDFNEKLDADLSNNLPNETILMAEDDQDIEYNGADQLSDKFYFCVNGFQFERI